MSPCTESLLRMAYTVLTCGGTRSGSALSGVISALYERREKKYSDFSGFEKFMSKFIVQEKQGFEIRRKEIEARKAKEKPPDLKVVNFSSK
jgi:hypothetical protein